MKSFLLVDFQLLDTDVLPADISKLTGITPNLALKRGETNKDKDLPRQNIWSVESTIDSHEISDYWDDLKDKLVPKQEIIRNVGKTGTVWISIVIEGGARVPSIQIPPEMSAFAGYVGAVIDIDHLQS